MQQIDLNSDLGESFGAWKMGDDAAMLDIVTSANVACGFHAGDPAGVLDTLRAAAQRGVRVGAHVAYPDLAGFGRRAMDVASADLRAGVIYQIGALQALARVAGTEVCYVKPHGALYNTMAHDERQATDVIEALRLLDADLALVVLAGSPLAAWARSAGLRVVAEAFADRGYTPQEGVVEAVDGSLARVAADSICVHGDSPDAVAMARAVRDTLSAAGVVLRPFCVDERML